MIESLKAEVRWLVWKDTNGKKLPHDPKNPDGKPIDGTDPQYWVDYDTARDVVRSGRATGIGFALGDGWSGIDLDGCRDPHTGALTPDAQRIVADLNSYTEISPSLEGLKVFVRAWLAKNHFRKGLEAYGGKRFFAVTEQHLDGTPTDAESRASEVETLIAREFPAAATKDVALPAPAGSSGLPDAEDTVIPHGERDNTLTSIAGKLRHINCSEGEIVAALQAISDSRCRPPVDRRDIERIGRSIGSKRPSDIEKAIDWMNQRHAVVTEAGKTIVFTKRHDPLLKRDVFDRSSFEDIHKRYLSHKFTVPEGKRLKELTLGHVWTAHPRRSEFDQVVFDPEHRVRDARVLNLWQGYTVEPKAGDWSLFHDHIHKVICAGDTTLFTYVLTWLAYLFQKPGRPGQVAIVMLGRQGTGKGVFARTIGSMLGQHFLHITSGMHLTGRFNGHLQDAVLVFADEAVAANDRTAQGTLKTITTEPMVPIERKGKDIVMVPNVMHLVVGSNHDHVWPADMDDRRALPFRVSNAHANDKTYFAAIGRQMRAGGREAMLADLLARDTSAFDPITDRPFTRELLRQKLQSLPPLERWWFERLWIGRLLPADPDWNTKVVREDLHAGYMAHLEAAGVRERLNVAEFGMRLPGLLPQGWPRVWRESKGRRRWGYELPSLSECRRAWDQHMRQPFDWPEGEQQGGLDFDEGNRAA